MTPFSMDDLMFRPGLMSGERILITGGGTGLGKVMAEACLMLGATVYICGRRGGVVEASARELMDAHGGRCVGLACDIRVPEAIEAMLDQIWADGGALTGLVNNAAGNFISRTEDLSPRAFDAIANIVFRGTFFVTQGCGKRWIAEGQKASVVSILTTWIWNGGPFTVPSAMSKAAVATMSQSLAVEWGSHGIRFNNIAPGPFPTEGMSARLNPGGDGQERSNAYGDMSANPMGRVGDMREPAHRRPRRARAGHRRQLLAPARLGRRRVEGRARLHPEDQRKGPGSADGLSGLAGMVNHPLTAPAPQTF